MAVDCCVDQAIRLARARCGIRWVFFANLFLSPCVYAEIHHNPINPRLHRTVELKTCQISVNSDKSLLVNVVRVLFGAGKLKRQAKYHAVIPAHQLLESGFVAVPRGADELLLDNCVAYAMLFDNWRFGVGIAGILSICRCKDRRPSAGHYYCRVRLLFEIVTVMFSRGFIYRNNAFAILWQWLVDPRVYC